jgi:S-adenosylmethionine synthetase
VIGGPQADTGVTGRKIMVDTYGGYCRHGGGAFSGKDPTKVDRSATYMARYLAKNIVAAGLCEKVELQIAYAIGVPQPVSLMIETFGTHRVDPEKIARRIQEAFDLSPRRIIQFLDLQKPQYVPTAKNGHFGNPTFRWEQRDSVPLFAELL